MPSSKHIFGVNVTIGSRLVSCALALVLIACAASPTISPSPAATAVALVASATAVPATASTTALPSATVTATDTSTPAPSATPSATASATVRPSATASATVTPTQKPSPRPTRPPVTLTATPGANAGLPDAPLYPKSPVVAWDSRLFIKAIHDSRANTEDFYEYHGRAVSGMSADCQYFWRDYARWEQQPGFTGVPAEWYPGYYQWRVTLQGVLVGIQPIVTVCLAGGGHINDDVDQQILAALSTAVAQLDQLAATVKTMAP